jgi:hypothetical protein
VCEYYAHEDCKDFAVNDCRETATYVPTRDNVKRKFQRFDKKIIGFFYSSQLQLYVIITIGVKAIYQQIPNVPYVEKHVGQVNVLLVCDVNGVE